MPTLLQAWGGREWAVSDSFGRAGLLDSVLLDSVPLPSCFTIQDSEGAGAGMARMCAEIGRGSWVEMEIVVVGG